MTALTSPPAERPASRHSTLALRAAVALCGLYFLLSGTLAVLQHVTFHTRARDMGIYAQILWNAAQGRGFASTLLMENTSHLAEHFAPVLWTLVPLYALLPTPAVLVVIQQLFLAASGIPVFLWARRVLDERLALLVLLAYLAMPAMSRIALSEFHPVVMAALPMSIAAYGVFTGNVRLAMIGIALGLFFEEETALVVIGLGLSWLLMHRRRWPIGAGVIALGVAWAVLAAFVILPSFQHRVSRESGNRAAGHYAELQEDPAGTVATYLSERTPDAIEWLLLPHAGFSLLAPPVLAAAAPATAVLFLQDRESTYGGHWAGAMIPIYAMATASGLALLQRARPPIGRVGAVVLAVFAGGTYLLHSHFPGGGDFDLEKFVMTQTERDMGEAVGLLPPEGRVTASRRVVPHIAHRPEVWQFPPTLYAAGLRPDADRQEAYIFDLTDSQTRRVLEDLNGDTVLTGRPLYHVRQFGDAVLLLTRQQPTPTVPLEVQFPNVATLRGFELERLPDVLRLRAYWEPHGRMQQDIVRVFRVTDDQGSVLAEETITPLPSVLPPTRWQRGQIVAEQAIVSLPASYRGPMRLLLGWRQSTAGPALPAADGTELVEVFR